MQSVGVGDRVSASLAVALAAGGLMGVCGVARGQSWAAPINGDWFNTLNWSPQSVPSGAGASGTLGFGSAYDVTTTTNTLSGVNIPNSLARLLVAGGNQLTLTGASAINGQLVVNGTAAYAGTTLIVNGYVVMNGNGRLVLNCSPSDPGTGAGTSFMNASAGGTLALGAGFTLGGFGRVDSVPTINSGTIAADVGGRPVYVNGAAHQNLGLYTAVSGAELRFSNATVVQGAGGSIAPQAGGVVTLQQTPLSGGSVTSTPTGRVQLGGASGLSGVTVTGGVDLNAGCACDVGAGGITLNNATLLLNTTAGYAGTTLRATQTDTAVNGLGTVLLNASPSDPGTTAGTAYLSKTNPAATFSFGPGITIAGFGWINGVSTSIAGQLLANVDGYPIRVDSSTHTVSGTMSAVGGGQLLLNSCAINLTGGGAMISATGAGGSGPSSVQLNSCTVTGGSLVSSGNAHIHLANASTISPQTIVGTLDIEPAAAVILAAPSVTLNNAQLLINRTAGYAGTSLRTDGPFTFNGFGEVRLNASTGDPSTTAGTSYLSTGGAGSFTFPAGVTLGGFGWINNVPTTNNSVFAADVNGYPIRIQGNTHQNNGTYRAINGGQLVLVSTTVNQSPGAQITVGDGSAATFSSVVINGGTVGSPSGGTGTVALDATTQRLNGVTVSRQATLNGGGVLSTTGLTLANNADLTINTTAGYAGTGLVASAAPTVLGGAGRIHLRASTSDSATTAGTADLRPDGSVPGSGFTIGSGITIDGFGQVSNCPTTNNGVIEANQAGYPIRFTSNTHQNNGVYRAVNGANLVFAGATITQAGGATTSLGDGSTLTLIGCDVSGGSINGTGTGAAVVQGSAMVHDLQCGVPISIPGGSSLTISGSVTADGLITVNPSASYAGTALYAGSAGMMLGGHGGVRLMRSPADPATTAGTADLRGLSGASLTMGPSQSLTGSGRIMLPVTNQGLTSPGVGAGSIDLMRIESGASVTMTPSSELSVELGSGGSFDQIANAGTFTAAGTVRVRALPGFSPSPGATFDIVSGGTTSGGFAQVISEGLTSPRRFGVRVDPGRVRVTVLCGAADIAGAGADANGDGVLNNNDFIVFINRFFAQDPSVDFGSAGGLQGADGHFDNNDFIAFIDLFFAGCP